MPRSTKAYLVPLLLLFLHVHAGRFGLHLLSVAAPPPPENIDGLSTVKAYLNSFGYFPDSDNFSDLLDGQAISSLQEYQQFFNLQVTGFPDNATIVHMLLPRCGVPDKNITYDLSPDHNVSWPLGTQSFPNGSRNLTYGFAPENELPKNVMEVFVDSFKRWSDAIGVVNLTETTSYDTANIKIGFYIFENGTIWEQVVGASVIKLESVNNVTTGYMVLVYDKSWVLPGDNISWENGDTDLESAVMHQIGHLLGLQHSSHEDSVMYPTILPSMQRKVNLSENDKEQINQLYFSAAISGVIVPFGSAWGLVGFYTLEHGDGVPFDGALGMLAHSFAPTDGRFHLDGAEYWVASGDVTMSPVLSAVDMESVAVHEIGHLLGLGHSSLREAIMYPTLPPRTRKVKLTEDDIVGVQRLYGLQP